MKLRIRDIELRAERDADRLWMVGLVREDGVLSGCWTLGFGHGRIVVRRPFRYDEGSGRG